MPEDETCVPGPKLLLLKQKNGATGRTRTDDLRFTKPLLYQLSYRGERWERLYFIKGLAHRLAAASIPH